MNKEEKAKLWSACIDQKIKAIMSFQRNCEISVISFVFYLVYEHLLIRDH